MPQPLWLEFVQQVKAISQTGKTYTRDPYDLERYDQLEKAVHEMLAYLSSRDLKTVEQCFLPEKGYATPKIDLRAGVFREGRILLVRERSDNRWTLPGGWADVCESPSEGIIREVLEESGYIVANPRLVAVVDRQKHEYIPPYAQHIYKMFFLCELVSGEPEPNTEISEIDFFSLDNLPELSLDRILPKDIQRLTQYIKEKNTPVYLD